MASTSLLCPRIPRPAIPTPFADAFVEIAAVFALEGREIGQPVGLGMLNPGRVGEKQFGVVGIPIADEIGAPGGRIGGEQQRRGQKPADDRPG